jgi:hypothetical protein
MNYENKENLKKDAIQNSLKFKKNDIVQIKEEYRPEEIKNVKH